MNNDLIFHERTQRQIDALLNHMPQSLVLEGLSGSGVVATAQSIAAHLQAETIVIKPKKVSANQPVVDELEGSIIIQDIRALYEQTRGKTNKRQVYILDTGERSVTPSAQNAFLKLLEEPRQGVHFIIATHRPDELLPTVRSRSQVVPLLPLSDEQVSSLLDTLGIRDATIRSRLAFIGRGLPALITRLATDNELYEHRVKIVLDAKTLIGNTDHNAFAVMHTYRDKRPDALLLLEDISQQLKVIMRKQADVRHAVKIQRCLEAHARIAGGGNIRLQLAAAML